ncbi:hypothetical protein JCGZ_00929 [Jatropha curcas]|uniref:DUF4408 domain-containing protein n=2 Tax=Jatropha curcas TaxID=180498 RepID=A0A067KSQ8_JATCU|nr:hypothetical protein JCGZ_00929 [Jatropha curcas]
MSNFKKSQILMLSLLAALLFVTPLLSSSLRPKYLYFIINLLILALGAEAGLLSAAFSKPLDDSKKNSVVSISTKPITQELASSPQPACTEKKPIRVVEKSASEKIVSSASINKADKVKKCPSMPSLFFIGNAESTTEMEDVQENKPVVVVEGEGEEVGELSGQELFTKAETFIGNFYKQLKMQREESWKRIHGFFN